LRSSATRSGFPEQAPALLRQRRSRASKRPGLQRHGGDHRLEAVQFGRRGSIIGGKVTTERVRALASVAVPPARSSTISAREPRPLGALALRGIVHLAFAHLAFGPTRVHGIGEAGKTGEIVIVLDRSDALRRVDKVVTALLKTLGG